MHAPTFPIDEDYARAWDEARSVFRDAHVAGIDLEMEDLVWDGEQGIATIDGMVAREWLDAMTMD